ncbi:MAG: hypothetical protein KAR11_06815 [Phycisphaerae bacterium]|nr:hypothetical protein [Phycisphaerae bacterium]
MKRQAVLTMCVLGLVVGAWAGDDTASKIPAKEVIKKAPGEKFMLVNNYKTGYYQSVTKMDMAQDMNMGENAPPQKMSMQQVMTLGMEVSKPDKEGDRTIVMSYERITMKSMDENGNVLMDYDSDLPEEEQGGMAATMFAPMLKLKFKMIVDKKGDVVEVKGFNEMIGKVIEENPALAPALEGLRKSLTDESIAEMASQSSKYLPKTPVGIGDKWKTDDDMKIPFLGKTNIKMDMEMVAVNKTPAGRIATIDMSGKMTGDNSENPMIRKLDMEFKGQELYNVDTLNVDKLVMNMTMSMEGGTPGPGGKEMTFTVVSKMKIETTMKHFGKKPAKKSADADAKKPTTKPTEK